MALSVSAVFPGQVSGAPWPHENSGASNHGPAESPRELEAQSGECQGRSLENRKAPRAGELLGARWWPGSALVAGAAWSVVVEE